MYRERGEAAAARGVTVDHVRNRLGYWPNDQTRAGAARLLCAEGWELGKVLALYPDEVIIARFGVTRGAARRAIWAHYSLLQQWAGEPDIDPYDRAAVECVISEEGEEGIEVARCRTGSSLSMYKDNMPGMNDWPSLAWYARQAPSSWPR